VRARYGQDFSSDRGRAFDGSRAASRRVRSAAYRARAAFASDWSNASDGTASGRSRTARGRGSARCWSADARATSGARATPAIAGFRTVTVNW